MNGKDDSIVADAVRGHWADRIIPPSLRPYARLARLERPIGWWLLLWPCWWSSVLATDAAGLRFPDFWHLALFLVGAIAMRGAGCTYNDIVDRDLDAQVARTRSRPIPSGQVTARQAAIFLVLQALIGLAVLLQFNSFAIALGVLSLITVAIYPFMKRFTWWPQIGLGLAFSWGALMGWPAAFGRLDWPAIVLYAGSISWVIGYDTIYAHQDKEDDALIGVKSLALRLGDGSKPWFAIGASGGRRIMPAVFQLCSFVNDFGMDLAAALDAPRVDLGAIDTIYADARLDAATMEALKKVAPTESWPPTTYPIIYACPLGAMVGPDGPSAAAHPMTPLAGALAV